MTKCYCLDENNNPVECDCATWGSNLTSLSRIVKTIKIGRYIISTAFIGIDPPLLFETTIRDNWGKEETVIYAKYATWQEAKVGHRKAVEYVRSELVPF